MKDKLKQLFEANEQRYREVTSLQEQIDGLTELFEILEKKTMKIKRKLKYLLNASNRHERVLTDLQIKQQSGFDTLQGFILDETRLRIEQHESLQKQIDNLFEVLSEVKHNKLNNLKVAADTNVVSKIIYWCQTNRMTFYGKEYILYDELIDKLKELR
jgi:chromosome segregation ATPase